MKVKEIVEGVSTAWKRGKSKNVRQYRCKSGPRKGRVMASPASCNAPLNPRKSAGLKKTKARLGGYRKFKSKQTRRRDPYSRRLTKLNK